MVFRPAIAFLGLMGFGCGQAASAPIEATPKAAPSVADGSNPTTPPVSSASAAPSVGAIVPNAPLPCGEIHGKIHGVSTCLHLDTSVWQVTPLPTRIPELAGTRHAKCDDIVDLGAASAKLVCTRGTVGPSVAVTLSFLDGRASVPLTSYDQYCDTIVFLMNRAGEGIDMTIDYLMLD